MTDQAIVERLRADIPYLDGRVYVDNASVSPMSRRVQAASARYDGIIATQLRDAKQHALPVFDRGRALAAKLVGARADQVTYVQNTSHGLSLVALGLDWRPGDNLVVCAQEFPSNYLCWIQLEEQGVEVRRIDATNGRLTPDQVRAVCDARTRIVSLSHVQYFSGFRADLSAMADLCREVGALLVVDGTQSVGAVGIDVGASGVDVLVVSAHKWLMGPRGIGFAAFSDRALGAIVPRVVGWLSVNAPYAFNRTLDFLPDARRYEAGTPNGCGIFGLTERLAEIDEIGMDWIESRILDLGALLREEARRHGLDLAYDFERTSASGINLLSHPRVSPGDMLAHLNDANIYASLRGGAIRVAPHCYNTTCEIQRIVHTMIDHLGRGANR
ncbi:aminotransferase class V-fold PLP-dependent enzyme [Acetobacter persici]|uniref:aminotransferase class V-fold PLP-dependent enzyme n=1 Tax=Acetobacter persici TaxID=1076596 RepID=UPI0039EB09E6